MAALKKISGSYRTVLLALVLIALSAPVLAQPATPPPLIARPKSDLVVLDNGDRLTGEIKELVNGILYLDSSRARGDLELDWGKVRQLQSTTRCEFETLDGHKYVGTIAPEATTLPPDGSITLNLDQGAQVHLNLRDILTIQTMHRNFWKRIDLEVDAGVSFMQGNQQTQWNGNLLVRYVRPKHELQIDVNSSFSGQEDAADTSRQQMRFLATRFLSRKWDAVGFTSLLHDTQLDLDLRTLAGGGLRRSFVKTLRTHFSAYGGFVYTREDYFPQAGDDRNNGEILAGLSVSTYRFRGSELTAYFSLFPSVTDTGRYRIDLNTYWKWEIIHNLYWKVSIFENYDNRPPSGASGNNFGISTTIGWST